VHRISDHSISRGGASRSQLERRDSPVSLTPHGSPRQQARIFLSKSISLILERRDRQTRQTDAPHTSHVDVRVETLRLRSKINGGFFAEITTHINYTFYSRSCRSSAVGVRNTPTATQYALPDGYGRTVPARHVVFVCVLSFFQPQISPLPAVASGLHLCTGARSSCGMAS
jgi:hypothetical protein